MKFRSTKNSIRIRVRKSELQKLSAAHKIEESINFGQNVKLTFALDVSSSHERVEATFFDNFLVVSLPEEIAKNWMNSDEVGIETNYSLSDGEELHILVEKDFPCLDRPEEDKSDTFQELAAKNGDHC